MNSKPFDFPPPVPPSSPPLSPPPPKKHKQADPDPFSYQITSSLPGFIPAIPTPAVTPIAPIGEHCTSIHRTSINIDSLQDFPAEYDAAWSQDLHVNMNSFTYKVQDPAFFDVNVTELGRIQTVINYRKEEMR